VSKLLSIVTISFNQAEFLEECLRSVLDQKSEEVEYIVVDPGSSDGSREIIDRHAGDIDHVVLEKDKGPADGLNNGFAKATGEYLGFLNADDRFLPGAFSFALQYFAEHPDCDVMGGALRIIDREGKTSPRARSSDRFTAKGYVAGLCTICQQATFFRRSCFEKVGGFNAANRIAWDGELLLDMALAGCRFETVHTLLADFRIYDENISGAGDIKAKVDAFLNEMKEKVRAKGVTPYGDGTEKFLRLLYTCNIARHIGYFTAKPCKAP
jgi:glycosyltransferase involved in cell wall biosynthesis